LGIHLLRNFGNSSYQLGKTLGRLTGINVLFIFEPPHVLCESSFSSLEIHAHLSLSHLSQFVGNISARIATPGKV
jgi:hypothetical protein